MRLLRQTETQGRQQEHHQLPPQENVPQGRRSQEEGQHPGLNLRSYVAFSLYPPRRRIEYMFGMEMELTTLAAVSDGWLAYECED